MRYAAGDMGRGESVACTGFVLSEACEALIEDATSRKAGDGAKGKDVSFRTAKAATVDGVGDERGEGEVAPGRNVSRAIAAICPRRVL